jgi:hypothetical protein
MAQMLKYLRYCQCASEDSCRRKITPFRQTGGRPRWNNTSGPTIKGHSKREVRDVADLDVSEDDRWRAGIEIGSHPRAEGANGML